MININNILYYEKICAYNIKQVSLTFINKPLISCYNMTERSVLRLSYVVALRPYKPMTNWLHLLCVASLITCSK